MSHFSSPLSSIGRHGCVGTLSRCRTSYPRAVEERLRSCRRISGIREEKLSNFSMFPDFEALLRLRRLELLNQQW